MRDGQVWTASSAKKGSRVQLPYLFYSCSQKSVLRPTTFSYKTKNSSVFTERIRIEEDDVRWCAVAVGLILSRMSEVRDVVQGPLSGSSTQERGSWTMSHTLTNLPNESCPTALHGLPPLLGQAGVITRAKTILVMALWL